MTLSVTACVRCAVKPATGVYEARRRVGTERVEVACHDGIAMFDKPITVPSYFRLCGGCGMEVHRDRAFKVAPTCSTCGPLSRTQVMAGKCRNCGKRAIEQATHGLKYVSVKLVESHG